MEGSIEKTKSLSKRSAVLSNPYRILIIQYLRKNNQANWSEINDYIQSKMGKLNPNTLHFHLKSLIKFDYVKRISQGTKLSYKLNVVDKSILSEIDKSME